MDRTASGETKAGQGTNQRCMEPSCGSVYSLNARIYVCPRCGGPLEVETPLTMLDGAALREQWRQRASSWKPIDRSGVWRFRELLPGDVSAGVVTLFEGNTPLCEAPLCAEYCGLRELRLKNQGSNPTGSFKDTGMTVAVTHAVRLGAAAAVCASTGNTAASLAAYCARARLRCAILVPHGQIASAKLAQSMDYGALLCELEGNFDDCMRVVQEIGDDPSLYIANSINPFRIEGQKTVAYELLEQSEGQVPDHVVVPGGNLGNSSALGKGFRELLSLGLIDHLPRLHVIQAQGAAPFVRVFTECKKRGSSRAQLLPEAMIPESRPQTLATAIRIGAPLSWRKSLRAVLESGGEVIAVTEKEIADAKAMIGRDGIGCEPASATTVAGIRKLTAAGRIQRDEAVVAVLTGHLLKDPEYVANYHRGTLALPGGSAQKIEGAFPNPPERVAATKSAFLELLKRHRP
ncbi:MAG TPA: threonine synthase [Candidatus Cybelea sp.]|nr:threonine synthase [Candidatus Cybelea sp.]